MVSILVFFPLPPSSVAHDLVGGAAPCSGSLHAAGAKASTHGQNGGIGFEKETCLLCFQATERKVKRLRLAIQILSSVLARVSCTTLGRTFNPFGPAAMPLRCKVVSYCQRSRGDVFTPFSEVVW